MPRQFQWTHEFIQQLMFEVKAGNSIANIARNFNTTERVINIMVNSQVRSLFFGQLSNQEIANETGLNLAEVEKQLNAFQRWKIRIAARNAARMDAEDALHNRQQI